MSKISDIPIALNLNCSGVMPRCPTLMGSGIIKNNWGWAPIIKTKHEQQFFLALQEHWKRKAPQSLNKIVVKPGDVAFTFAYPNSSFIQTINQDHKSKGYAVWEPPKR